MPRAIVVLSSLISAALVLWLGSGMPDQVASHFGTNGVANGFMPRWLLIGINLAVMCCLPLAAWFMQERAVRGGYAKLPNAAFWLSASQRLRTESFVKMHAAMLAVATTVFFLFVFLLVVRANRSAPAVMDMPDFFVALGVFLAFIVGWVISLQLRFRK